MDVVLQNDSLQVVYLILTNDVRLPRMEGVKVVAEKRI